MPSSLTYPGVYVEELPSGVRTITGVATSVTAFIGRARKGPIDQAVDITSFADFERTFGGLWLDSTMSFAVRDFFLNGGARAVIVRLFHSYAADAAAAAITAVADAAAAAAAAAGATGASVKVASKQKADAINADANAKPAAKAAATAANAAFAGLADGEAAPLVIADAVTKARDAGATPPIDARAVDVDPLKFRAASPGRWAGGLRVLVEAASGHAATNAAQALHVQPSDLFTLTVTDTNSGGGSETYLNLNLKDNSRRVDRVLATESSLLVWDAATPLPAALPDFNKVKGDALGQTYAEWLTARAAADFDPTADTKAATAKNAKEAYDKARKAAFDALDDGAPFLGPADFRKPNGEAEKTGLFALEQLYTRDGIFNLLCLPPHTFDGNVDTSVVAAAGAYCEKRRAMLLLDSPKSWNSVQKATEKFSTGPDEVGYRGRNAALFFPRLKMPNPLRDNQMEDFAACGAVAGIFARTDTQRGVWKSPAGLDASFIGVSSFTLPLTDEENGMLNPLGINCLRTFPVFGRVLWGARTLRGADAFADEYKYTAVRRTALFIEESLYRALKWVVFEPNDEPLWAQIRLNVGAFMHNLFRQGAFQGQTKNEAYFVHCDATTTTQNDINLGIVNVNVGFAPLKPAEFVVIRLQQMAGQIET